MQILYFQMMNVHYNTKCPLQWSSTIEIDDKKMLDQGSEKYMNSLYLVVNKYSI